MPALPVVEALDVIEDIGSGLRSCCIGFSIHSFPLQQSKEALHGSIVITAPDCAHATNDVVLLEKGLIFVAGIL